MKGARHLLALAAISLLAAPTRGQIPQELHESSAVAVLPKQVVYAFPEPMKCISSGNIYYRVYKEGVDDIALFPVMRISPEGKSYVFPIPSPEGRQRGILDFAPTGGGVALLTTDYGEGHYLDFLSETGELTSESHLPREFEPMQMSVSDSTSREILISGLWSKNDAGATQAAPFVGIFDSKGALKREVSPPSDIEPGSSATPSEKGEFLRAVEGSIAQVSGDGNFVLARPTGEGQIFVISPGGQLLNEFRPSLPEGASPTTVTVDGNTVVIVSAKKISGSTQNQISDVFISLWDGETGKQLASYHHSSPRFGAGLACYQRGVFTFLSAAPDTGEFQLVRAVGR